MTEYESVYLFRELVNDVNQITFGYLSFVYGFLVVSYLVADKLNRVLTSVVLSLYVITDIYFIFVIYFYNVDLDNLYVYIQDQIAAGVYDLSWFGRNPAWATRLGTVIQIIYTFGALIGSLVFFFHRRRQVQQFADKPD